MISIDKNNHFCKFLQINADLYIAISLIFTQTGLPDSRARTVVRRDTQSYSKICDINNVELL